MCFKVKTPSVANTQMTATQLLPQTEATLLCGSGSTVGVLCGSYQDAYECTLDAFKRGWWNRVTSFAPVGASVLEAY